MKEDPRKIKRIVNRLSKKAGYGKYVVDCRYHPCIVTAVDRDRTPWSWGCDVKSLFNGNSFCCSYMYCGIEPITKQEAFERVEFRKTHSFNEYLIKYKYYTEEDIQNFEEQDKVWNYDKGETTVSDSTIVTK